MSDGTKVVRFTRTEKYQCDGTVHVYRDGDTHRFIDDYADKWLNLQAAQLSDEDDAADLELTPRPEPRVPGATKADAVPVESVFERPRRGRPPANKPVAEVPVVAETPKPAVAAVPQIAPKRDEATNGALSEA
jgi:hypothetical protein